MKIRTRLAVLFTIITAAILLAFACIIYFSAKEKRENEFYDLLKKEAITKFNLLFNAGVDAKTLQEIYKNNRRILYEVEVAIYDTSFNLIYHDAVDIDFVKETREMIRNIYDKEEMKFFQDDWQVIGFRYLFQDKYYIITAAAYDQYGYNKLNSLLRNIIIAFIASILIIYLAGIYFSKKAFEPVREMTEKAKLISATSLDLRLRSNGNRDELSELASTFNDMLSRLESSFDAQKNFVSNISHELRTPLSAIIAELELALSKDRANEEYKTIIQRALSDAQKLARLSNSLLDLAKAHYDITELSYKKIRIDEVLLDARQIVLQSNPNYKIHIHFDQESESVEDITINGNEYLLRVAFANLMDNGCKFSEDNSVDIHIKNIPGKVQLLFCDKGLGIPDEDIPKLFTPFFRGKNNQYAQGYGIGLSLTHKIITLHKGSIDVSSKVGQGSTFIVVLPV